MNDTIYKSHEIVKAIGQTSFSEQLLEKSEGLKKEVVIEKVIDQELIDKLLQLSKDALVNLCEVKQTRFGFRLWKANEKRAASFVRQNVYNNPPLPHESLADWTARVFSKDDDEICMIMNNAEAFEDEIAVTMGRLFRPVLENIGIPMNGTHSTSIFGNYSYTPLGIHTDEEGSFVINLHLGPAVKRMYTWEWDEFLALGGRTNDTNVEKYLSHATEYIINPGDVFFMPWNKFHVGYNEGFSLSMTNWFDFHSADKLIDELLVYLKKFMRVKNDFLSEAVTEANHTDEFQKVIREFQFEGNRGDVSLKQNLIDAQEQKMLKLFSNGGWKSAPMPREANEGFDKMDFSFLQGKKLRLLSPFKLHSKIKDEHIYIFIRGHIRKYKYDTSIERLIEMLNTMETFEVSELLQLRPSDWEESSWQYLVTTFYNLRGVEIL